jgi:hypothetical protein
MPACGPDDVDASVRLRSRLRDDPRGHLGILAQEECFFQLAAVTGRCARRKERIWRTARGILSLGSFQGKRLTSDFGASITDSMATA